MQTDDAGKAFIQGNESAGGPLLTIKPDTGGKQQIGWGHNLLPGEAAEFANGITYDQAVTLFDDDINQCDDAVAGLNWTLTQNQWNALADFAYEFGGGGLRQLAAHGQDQVPVQLVRWVHALVEGVETVLPGLVVRRNKEIALWNS